MKEKKGILVVSYGTANMENGEKSIGGIETAVKNAYADWEVRRAFSSKTIIDKLKKYDNVSIDTVEQALDNMIQDGIKTLVVQPTHLLKGFDYERLVKRIAGYKGQFSRLQLAPLLLTKGADYEAVGNAIVATTMHYDDGETAICVVGHGTQTDADRAYAILQKKLRRCATEHYYVGTLKEKSAADTMVHLIKNAGKYKKVVLVPFMITAGSHVMEEIVGEQSWKSVFEQEGFEVECVLEGLGQNQHIQEIYVKHLREMI